jgi:EmrB/QacA subfamily drug resistance transporter
MSSRPVGMPSASGLVDKRVALIVVSLANFLTPFMGSSVNVALPSIAQEFHVGAITLTWITNAYLLAAAMFMIPIGKLADIHGRRKVFLLGVAGYTLMSLLCSVATSEAMLISFRALQGFTDALMFGTASAILTSVYPPEERGRALGISVAGVFAGGASGPFIGGFLTQTLGWRSIYLLTALLGLAAIVMIFTRLKGEWAEARGQKLDVVGSAIYAVTLAAIMYGFTLLPAISGFALICAGLGGLVAFVLWESRVPNPVLEVKLFRHNHVFAFSNLAALINFAATAAIAFLLSLYLQYIKGVDPSTAGLILLAQPIMMATFSPLAGRFADRFEPRILATAGMLLLTLGLVLIAFLDAGSSLVRVVVPLVICGLGFAFFSSPNVSAIMGSVDRAYLGMAAATTAAMRLVGQMLSMGIATLILALYMGNAQITPQYYPAFLASFRTAFSIFAVLCLAGAYASLSRGKLHDRA